MFSKKAIKIDEIFTVDLTFTISKCQIDDEDFVHFCGLLRKHELYEKKSSFIRKIVQKSANGNMKNGYFGALHVRDELFLQTKYGVSHEIISPGLLSHVTRTTKGVFFSESEIRFSNLQISKINYSKSLS